MARDLTYRSWPVYLDSLEFASFVTRTCPQIPRGQGDLLDQLRRAANSIILNISEGAGRYLELDKQRFYLTAAGSASECGGAVDLLHLNQVISDEDHARIIDLLGRICGGLEALAIKVGGPAHKNERRRSSRRSRLDLRCT